MRKKSYKNERKRKKTVLTENAIKVRWKVYQDKDDIWKSRKDGLKWPLLVGFWKFCRNYSLPMQILRGLVTCLKGKFNPIDAFWWKSRKNQPWTGTSHE